MVASSSRLGVSLRLPLSSKGGVSQAFVIGYGNGRMRSVILGLGDFPGLSETKFNDVRVIGLN